MLENFYKNFILKYPKSILLLLMPLFLYFGYISTHLKIDTSSKALLMDNDSDLLFLQKINRDFYNPDILVVTFTPKGSLFSKDTLKSIKNLSQKIEKLPNVASVTSILNVPLLENKELPISDLLDKVPTLSSKDVNLTLAKKEFLTSPLYKNNLVSSDFKTTAIVLNLKTDKNSSLLPRHIFLQKIRKILALFKDKGKLFLGGVDMISDDMIGFVKNDIFVYGISLTLILVVILWIIFKESIWVIMPIVISILSIITTSALIVLFGWRVTIVSSNYVSLQLIITLSIILHLIVRYRELALQEPHFDQKKLILTTITSKAKPSFYAIATTVVGFASLIFSGIKPIVYLGLMMSLGISVSLIISFVLFGAIMMLFPKKIPKIKKNSNQNFSFMHHIIKIVEKRQTLVIASVALISIVSIAALPKLLVENSFINYFKSTTEIYKSLKTIDQKLGGTTPLDVVVTFKEEKKSVQKVSKKESIDEDDFDDFEDEYTQDSSDPTYWFTPSKLKTIQRVHDYLDRDRYIGSVQSLATLLKIGKILKKGKDFDSFDMALVYKKLPEKFKKILLLPYINIKENELRVTTRIIDSDKTLRRDRLIHKINRDLKKIVDPKIASFKLGNLMILYNNVLQSLYRSQILTLGITFIALLIMFVILFKSLKIALIALFSNIIPIGVVFAIMGWGEIPLDMMTITIASISMGIGVDDTIHYIHRFEEEFKKDKNYIKAMRRSHKSIGYAMYYTSLAIILGFSILTTSNFIPTIYFGLLTVVVMLVALLSALLLLPILIIKSRSFS